MTIDSSQGVGTSVRIHLPREQLVDASTEEPEGSAADSIHDAMILVVEDDVDVRALVIEQLEDLGCRAE